MEALEDGTGEEALYEEDLELVHGALLRRSSNVDLLLHRLRFVPRVLRSLNARMGCPLDDHRLADISQDVFVIVWRKLGAYSGRKPLEAWAYRICRLELMNGIRRRQRHSMSDLHPETPARAGQLPWEHEELHRGLETLSEDEAAVIQLKHFEGLTFEELAARLSISSNTAKTRYYRALTRLEAFLSARRPPAATDAGDGPAARAEANPG